MDIFFCWIQYMHLSSLIHIKYDEVATPVLSSITICLYISKVGSEMWSEWEDGGEIWHGQIFYELEQMIWKSQTFYELNV